MRWCAVLVVVLVAGCGSGNATSQGGDASAPAGCAKDTDCKGDRICVSGRCNAPGSGDAGAAPGDAGSVPPDMATPDLGQPPDLLMLCGAAVCNFANASALCVNGMCVLGNCNLGFANCNGIDADGCEASLNSGPANCGGCKMACSMNHVANVGCANGACVGNCDPGYADCNSDRRKDGCETRVSDDWLNCGGCGAICQDTNKYCSGGQCIVWPGAACDPKNGQCCQINMNGEQFGGVCDQDALCQLCGDQDQECCPNFPCRNGLTCTKCAQFSWGKFTRCEDSLCGLLGHACCWNWPPACGGSPWRFCSNGNGTCKHMNGGYMCAN